MKQEILNNILFLSPLLIGGIIAVINADSANNTAEKIEAWIRKIQSKVASKDGWLSRYIANPPLWIIVKFCDWTDDFTHRGIKNGARIAAIFYLVAAWCFILYATFVIAVAIIIIAIILFIIIEVLENSSDGSRSSHSEEDITRDMSDEEEDIPAGIRGKSIYDISGLLKQKVGRIDEDGNIYDTSRTFDNKIGRIDDNGNVYNTVALLDEKVGRIDDDGNVYRVATLLHEKIGKINKDGSMHDTRGILNKKVGKIE